MDRKNLGTRYRCIYECAGVCKIRTRVCFVVGRFMLQSDSDNKSRQKVDRVCVSVGMWRAGWYKSLSFHSIDDFLRRPFSGGKSSTRTYS